MICLTFVVGSQHMITISYRFAQMLNELFIGLHRCSIGQSNPSIQYCKSSTRNTVAIVITRLMQGTLANFRQKHELCHFGSQSFAKSLSTLKCSLLGCSTIKEHLGATLVQLSIETPNPVSVYIPGVTRW